MLLPAEPESRKVGVKLFAFLSLLAVSGCGAVDSEPVSEEIRFATFNCSLQRSSAGALIEDLRTGVDPQARSCAEILQRVRPDVVLLNEFDFDPEFEAATLFRELYLERSQSGAEPIEYPFVFSAPVNTGVPTGLDLDRDGVSDGPGDAFGFGRFPGQYGMLVLSRHPIAIDEARTFQKFLWKDMPGSLLPSDYYTDEARAVLRLSSKSHWDLPIQIGERTVHLLCAHPTPPVFDGPEDRNGRRNHDEIRFWSDYLTADRSDSIRDDLGRSGGLADEASFVIVGDYNSDPFDGDSVPGAIDQLLDHPRVSTEVTPSSRGGVDASADQGGVNTSHRGDPSFDTADFGDGGSGNLRVDYCLPSTDLEISSAGVFWPAAGEDTRRLVGDGREPVSSDHRLVFIDVRLPD